MNYDFIQEHGTYKFIQILMYIDRHTHKLIYMYTSALSVLEYPQAWKEARITRENVEAHERSLERLARKATGTEENPFLTIASVHGAWERGGGEHDLRSTPDAHEGVDSVTLGVTWVVDFGCEVK